MCVRFNRCEGGELFDQICDMDEGHYREQDACVIMQQIAQGLIETYFIFETFHVCFLCVCQQNYDSQN